MFVVVGAGVCATVGDKDGKDVSVPFVELFVVALDVGAGEMEGEEDMVGELLVALSVPLTLVGVKDMLGEALGRAKLETGEMGTSADRVMASSADVRDNDQ